MTYTCYSSCTFSAWYLLHKIHWYTYPKTPKINAYVKRFNRTLQEEFLNYHEDLLFEPQAFNRELIAWLLWYNSQRPHWGLKLKSPVQFLMEQKPKECKMRWPNTTPDIIILLPHSPIFFLTGYLAGDRENELLEDPGGLATVIDWSSPSRVNKGYGR